MEKLYSKHSRKKFGSSEIELLTEPAEEPARIHTVSITNFSSSTKKITIGVKSLKVDPVWHPIVEWTNVDKNSTKTFTNRINLGKGEMIYAKLEVVPSESAEAELTAYGDYVISM